MVIVRIRTMDISIYIEVQMIVLHRFKIHSLKKKKKITGKINKPSEKVIFKEIIYARREALKLTNINRVINNDQWERLLNCNNPNLVFQLINCTLKFSQSNFD